MIDDHELEQLLTDIESDRTERNESIADRDRIREAICAFVRNAVMHRDYATSNAPTRMTWFADRVEIQNPGGPFGQVTAENFGQPGITDYRNPNVAEAMKTLGFVQRFGVGIATARRQLSENGNPEPEFEIQPNHVLAIVRRRP